MEKDNGVIDSISRLNSKVTEKIFFKKKKHREEMGVGFGNGSLQIL